MHNFVCSSILTVHHWKKKYGTEKIAVLRYESIAVRNYTFVLSFELFVGGIFFKDTPS